MRRIDVRSFERRIRIRPLRIDDYDEVVKLQLACFPGMKPWRREQFESQIGVFPEGQICVEYQKRIRASSASLIVDFSQYSEWHNWKEIADGGFIRNHNPEGDTLYGIEIMVHPRYRGLRLARRLYSERKRIARERNLARIIIGGRIPGYGEHAAAMTVREYVDRVMDKSFFDPVLTPQLSNGFVLKRIIPDYFPTDSESRGYATFLEWTNLDYAPGGSRRLKAAAPVRVCAIQYMMRRIESFDDFARQVKFFVDAAGDQGSDFVLFPELFTAQLLSLVEAERPGLAVRALAEFTPQYLDLCSSLAVKYNVNIIGGSHFCLEEDVLYNVAYLFERNGSIGKQYKLHVTPNERRWWGISGGKRLEVFDTDRGKVAILIGYDVEFPELARIAADRGAFLLFVPFDTGQRTGYLRVRVCAQARAIENQVYCAISGCVGNLPFVDNADIHYAQSGIFTPSDVSFSRDGIAAECTPNTETIVVYDLDPELVERYRMTGNVRNINDRRKDLFSVVYTPPPEEPEGGG
jgi:predicted amidohydrolase/ribosomal protein S18 acetylase RimI-like enzyme